MHGIRQGWATPNLEGHYPSYLRCFPPPAHLFQMIRSIIRLTLKTWKRLKLCMRVSTVVCPDVCPKIGWRPGQGVPQLSPKVSWEKFQLSHDPNEDKQYENWIAGWLNGLSDHQLPRELQFRIIMMIIIIITVWSLLRPASLADCSRLYR